MKKIFYLFSMLFVAALASCGGQSAPASAAEKAAQDAGETIIQIETAFGTIKAKLYNSTPQHRDNFVKLAKEGFYDGTLFHRVIDGFMVQGGDPNSKGAAPGTPLGMGGPGYTIPAEIGAKHFRGAIAAARLGGPSNPNKESSGSQFYIVQNGVNPQNAQIIQQKQAKGVAYSQGEIDFYNQVGGYPGLDGEYTVFGQVLEGMEVVDKISKVAKNERDRPDEDVKMTVKVLK
ncbi:MAG: peptidylprolyl isomerase [Bacteroidota bacterium]